MLIFTLFFGGSRKFLLTTFPIQSLLTPSAVVDFFANAITNSGNSLVGSANLITKVTFPE